MADKESGWNDRLIRIEDKVDSLSEAMISLARTEEKMVALQDDHKQMYQRMNRFSEKLDDIEKTVNDNTRTVQFINKLFWILIVAIVGAITAQYWM